MPFGEEDNLMDNSNKDKQLSDKEVDQSFVDDLKINNVANTNDNDSVNDVDSIDVGSKISDKSIGNSTDEVKVKGIVKINALASRIKGWFNQFKPLGHKQRALLLGKKSWGGTKRLSKRWFIEAFTGMAQGLFVTLIAGLIIKQIGIVVFKDTTAIGRAFIMAGNVASMLMGAGIGAGIAHRLKAPPLVIFSAIVAGLIGAFSTEFLSGTLIVGGKIAASPGNPVSAYICSLLAIEVSLWIAGKTKLDILLVPLTVICVAMCGAFAAKPFVWLITELGKGIELATTAQPFIMGVIISVVVGILLTMPTSSAAICISVGIGGIAGGAAVVGCACHMVGFAVQSFRENRFSGLISQGIGTSMLQIPNIMKKPIIIVPPIIASAIAGPLATCVFKLQCSPAGSGMGTSGFVGVIATLDSSIAAGVPSWLTWLGIVSLFIVLPAVVCLTVSELFRKLGWIKYGDMKLTV